MKTFFVIICCLGLGSFASAAQLQQDENNPRAKKKARKTSVQSAEVRRAEVNTASRTKVKSTQKKIATGKIKNTTVRTEPTDGRRRHFGNTDTRTSVAPFRSARTSSTTTEQRRAITTSTTTATSRASTFRARRFNLQTQSRPRTIAAVSYRSGARIQGSQNWQGSRYTAFRNYSSQWHDRTWWRRHHDRIVFVFGGWYYWNQNYWYPAWGYDRNAYYAYDGPIYAYNGLPPDQVVANVQAALQAQGYYTGEVDGLLGPLTRAAVARYQQDRGLYVTSALDEPTLAALGMA